MRKLTAFNFLTLNGFYKGKNGDISWHVHGPEENSYAADMLKSGNILLFGRVTYDMMAGYWPTPAAIKNDPIVAEGMNKADKIVFSRTMKTAGWRNSRVVRDNMIEEIRTLKQTPGAGMTLLGSGTIVTQFAEGHLIDEYQIMVDPVVLAAGTPFLHGISSNISLRLSKTRSFRSGVVLLCYQEQIT